MAEHKKEEGPTEGQGEDNVVVGQGGGVAQGHDMQCEDHGDKELELYCETCEKLICSHCALKGGNHHTHDYQLVTVAYERYKEEITPSLAPMEKQLIAIGKGLALLDERVVEVSEQGTNIEARIHKTIEQLHKLLDVRRTELVAQLQQVTGQRVKGLVTQKDQLEVLQLQVRSCLEFVRKSLDTDKQREVLQGRAVVAKQLKDLSAPLRLDINTKADMAFSSSVDMTMMCRNYGQISAPGLPDPSKCVVVGKGLEVGVVGEEGRFRVETISFEGKACQESYQSLECELVSELTGTRASCSVERREQSQYEVSYQPTIKGRHQLHIKVMGEHIRASPYSVAVKSPVDKLLGLLPPTVEAGRPFGVAINPRGEMVVTEFGAHCVSVFSPSLEKLWSFGTRGSGQQQFLGPTGVAVDDEGNIFVADCGNHRIQKFTAEGRFLLAVGTQGREQLQFEYPLGIALSPSGKKLYVVDHDRIQVLNSDLTYVKCFGSELQSPWYVACSSSGKVYITDKMNRRIQVFTAKGVGVSMFRSCEELARPTCITIKNDFLYVSDEANNRILVLTPEGQFLTMFGREGRGPGEFWGPRGLAVDDCGVVYVCDRENNRIQMI